jgi:hypothetical protein
MCLLATTCLYSLTVLLQNGGAVVSIPIQNPSFEQGSTGWTFPLGGGVIKQPDGTSVAYAGSGSRFFQTLNTSPADIQEYRPGYTNDGVYRFTFSVANYFPSYPGYFKATVSFGTQELCEAPGWGTKTFTQVTAICPSPGYIIVDHSLDENGNSGPVQGTSQFLITFSVGGWPVLIAGPVSFTFTPQ